MRKNTDQENSEYEIQSMLPYSFQMRENADQKNSKYEDFLRSDYIVYSFKLTKK